MSDSWCSKKKLANGRVISGGAARNSRIKENGGMDNIITRVAEKVERDTLAYVKAATMEAQKRSKPKLTVVQ